jgi:hypothetical protein
VSAWPSPEQIHLNSWAGYRKTRTPRRSFEGSALSDGIVSLFVHPPDGATGPTSEQTAAIEFLLSRESQLSSTLVETIFRAYPRIREEYLECTEDDDVEELIPEMETADSLKGLIGLANVHILPVARDGLAYVGFEFGCMWEEEGGLGVMTHGDRVVAMGQSESSFELAPAEQDRERSGDAETAGP